MKHRKSVIVVVSALLALSGQVLALATACPMAGMAGMESMEGMEGMAMHMESMADMGMTSADDGLSMPGHDMSSAETAAKMGMDLPSSVDCQCDQLCNYCLNLLPISQKPEGFPLSYVKTASLGELPLLLPPSPPDNPYRPPITA